VEGFGPSPSVVDDADVTVAVDAVVEQAHQCGAPTAGAFRFLPDVALKSSIHFYRAKLNLHMNHLVTHPTHKKSEALDNTCGANLCTYVP
jgi:hypothetical protein